MRNPANKQTNKQTNKEWHSEIADPAKALGPSDFLDRNPVVELCLLAALSQSFWQYFPKKSVSKTGIKVWPHRGSHSRPSRFQHNALTDWAIAPYSSDYYYSRYSPNFIKIRPVVREKQLYGSQIRISIRITPNFELGLPKIFTSLITKLHQNPTSSLWEILLTNKQTIKRNGTRKAQIPRKPLDPPISWVVTQSSNFDPYQSCRLAALWQSFWQYFPKKSVFKTGIKFWPHRGSHSRPSRFQHKSLTDWAISPYSSDYYYSPYSPNFIKIRPVVHEKQSSGSQMRISIRISPKIELGLPMTITSLLTKFHKNPTSSLWETLLTNKQTNKQTNKEWHSDIADPAKALGPSDFLDRNPVVELCLLAALSQSFWQYFPKKNCFQNWNNKVLATQRFELSTLAFSAQCPNWLSYRAVLIWLIL